jgi:hypothetical protein
VLVHVLVLGKPLPCSMCSWLGILKNSVEHVHEYEHEHGDR